VHRFTLANGLRVLALPHRMLPVVAVRAFVEADERFDPETHAGLAHFAGRMLEEGAGARSGLQIAEAIESVGGNLDADEEGVSGRALAKDLPLLLELISDCLARPTFPADRAEQLRERILAEIAGEEDEPQRVGAKALREMVYEGHPYHHPANGTAKTVKAIGVADLRAHHERFYAPGNTLLAVVGDFDIATLGPAIEKGFGAWPARPVELPALPKLERATAAREKTIPMDREQVNLYLGHLGVRRDNPDYYALQVMDSILGTSPGFTDRLSRILRDEQGLAYTVRANIASSAGKEPGLFVATIGCSPKNRDKALEGMTRIIGEMRTAPVSAQELKDAQDYLTGSFVFNLETAEQLAGQIIAIERHQLGDDYVARYPSLIRAVTVADVERAARTYIEPSALARAEVGPRGGSPTAAGAGKPVAPAGK
jgi:zinc protease